MKILFTGLFLIATVGAYSQNQLSRVSGNIESNFQLLNEDTLIGAFAPTEKSVINSFMNLNYEMGRIKAGVRFESYLPSIAGYPNFYSGTGLGYRYAQYNGDDLTVKLGNFYEQFGSGMILRAFEESALGLDNAFDGININFSPRAGVELKGLVGRQRYNFKDGTIEKAPGIVRGIDGNIQINQLIPAFSTADFKIDIGGSYVSRFQDTPDTTPENVNSYAGRLAMYYKRFYLNAEYVHKNPDPGLGNGQSYNTGHGALVNMGYSQKGLGIILTARSVNNMVYRSNKKLLGNQAWINYLPAISNNHTYNLAGSLYPYAANVGGEIAYQLDVLYKIPKKTRLGGKYGTDLHMNVSVATDYVRHTTGVNTAETGVRFIARPFDMRDSLYNFDFNFHVSRKFNKKLKASLHYYHFIFNNNVNPVTLLSKGYIKSDIGVIDVQYRINRKHSLRFELQGLWTKKDRGNWASATVEYTISPAWFISLQDVYNYGNPDEALQLHYLLGSFGYTHKTARFMFSYGKQRAGIVCIGGVCRPVPATNGLTFTFTQSF